MLWLIPDTFNFNKKTAVTAEKLKKIKKETDRKKEDWIIEFLEKLKEK